MKGSGTIYLNLISVDLYSNKSMNDETTIFLKINLSNEKEYLSKEIGDEGDGKFEIQELIQFIYENENYAHFELYSSHILVKFIL